MPETKMCPKCGAGLPADAPAGICPKCLMQAGLASEQEAGAAPEMNPTELKSGFIPPEPKELAKHFPQLEILELLGKGGMGAVYKARQPGLDRLVAVKILPPEISRDPAFAERFQREARALARLSHPHIVAVYDFGVVAQAGLCYIVMEFVDGANLRQAIRTGKLTSAEALAIVPQICEALQFAHDEGIVHRDIKPENILIDKRGRVKIADFGLAKLLGQDTSDHSLTATNQVMGTLRYMAPEQMQGSREVDHRADIYSLGVVFYELLTGELPMGRFAPPSKRVEVDVRLDEIVLRALEQQPEQRYRRASQIKSDVESVITTPVVLSGAAPTGHPQSAARVDLTDQSEASLSRCALVGAIWAPLFFIMAGASMISTTQTTGKYTGPAWWQLALAFTLLPLGVLAPFGTTILGAVAIGKINRSNGKLCGLRLAQTDVLLFPMLLLGAAAFLAAWLLLRGPLRSSGLDESIFFSPRQEMVMALIALPIWLFLARALFRAVVGPRDAFALRELPLVGDEPLTGKATLFVSLAAIAAHAWPWHALIPPQSTLRVVSNFGQPGPQQSLFLLALTIGTWLFAAARNLALPAQKIMRVVAGCCALAALVIQAQFFFTLGEWESGQFGATARFMRSYPQIGIYGTMALTGLTILLLVLRLLENERRTRSEFAADVKTSETHSEATHFADSGSASASRQAHLRPKLVPVLATFNVIGAILLMLVSAAEQPSAFTPNVARVWQVWEKVDSALGFTMAAGLFAASIGLFLWKPWARKLTIGVCIFGLASFVFDVPYLARFALPDIYADIQQTVIDEGIEPEARDFVALLTVVVLFGGIFVVGLTWLIGQLVYFTRPRVVAAFESHGEQHGKFIAWLFTGAGAVVGVLSVFGPLALLLGLTALFNGSGRDQSVLQIPASVPLLGKITSGIGAEFTVPAGQVATFEIVTRRDNETEAVLPHCGYVMAPPDSPIAGTFRWSPKSGDVIANGGRKWSLEIVTSSGSGYNEAMLLPEELNDAVGARSLGLGVLEPNEETIHWGINDVRDLPAHGLIGLRVTVVAHGMKSGGSGNGHIDWKKAQSAQSTTRRKLSDVAP